MGQPTIDVVFNNITCAVGWNGKDSSTKADVIAEHLVKWSQCGMKLVSICNGTHPVSKQATNLWQANHKRNHFKSFVLRKEIHGLKRQMNDDDLSDDRRAEIKTELATKEMSCKSKESQSGGYILNDFPQALEEDLANCYGAHLPNDSGGFVDCVIQAEYQADAVINCNIAKILW